MWPFRSKKSAPAVSIRPYQGHPTGTRLGEAANARDWATVREILSGTQNQDLLSWYFEIVVHAPGLQDWIGGPVKDEPDSTLPLLVQGARGIYWAWEARGTGRADSVTEDQWKVWFRRLKQAEDCLDEVVERDPSCAEAWHYLVVLGRARQLPIDEQRRRFNNLTALQPHHQLGHEQMLSNLMAKWSGSDEEMFDFAHSRAAACPGTSVPVLIAYAHLEHRFDNGGAAYMERPEVGEELAAAAKQSIWHPAYRETIFTPSVWNVFAKSFALADRFDDANRAFDQIGEDHIRPTAWSDLEQFVSLRDYVRARR